MVQLQPWLRIVNNYEGNLNRDKNIKDGLKVS